MLLDEVTQAFRLQNVVSAVARPNPQLRLTRGAAQHRGYVFYFVVVAEFNPERADRVERYRKIGPEQTAILRVEPGDIVELDQAGADIRIGDLLERRHPARDREPVVNAKFVAEIRIVIDRRQNACFKPKQFERYAAGQG